jgi:hypothetical protein
MYLEKHSWEILTELSAGDFIFSVCGAPLLKSSITNSKKVNLGYKIM